MRRRRSIEILFPLPEKEIQEKDCREEIPEETRETAEEIVEDVIKNELGRDEHLVEVALGRHGVPRVVEGGLRTFQGEVSDEGLPFAAHEVPLRSQKITRPEEKRGAGQKEKADEKGLLEFFPGEGAEDERNSPSQKRHRLSWRKPDGCD